MSVCTQLVVCTMLAARHRIESDDNQNELVFVFMFMEFYFVPFCSTARVARRWRAIRKCRARACAVCCVRGRTNWNIFLFHVTANLLRVIEIVFGVHNRTTITPSDVCGALIISVSCGCDQLSYGTHSQFSGACVSLEWVRQTTVFRHGRAQLISVYANGKHWTMDRDTH